MRLLPRGPETISPTAHFTGYVWVRGGLAPRALATRQGRVFYDGLRPLMAVAGVLGAPTLESFLLARHRTIDARLEAAIEAGQISQVIEIAAGMSGRGYRFAARHGAELTYVEADLPAMAGRKRRALASLGMAPDHRVVDVDALRASGPGSVEAIAAELDRGRGLAIVTEGLLNYLAPDDLASLWSRIAQTLAGFPEGLYLSDLHLAGDIEGGLPAPSAAPSACSCAGACTCTSTRPRRRGRRSRTPASTGSRCTARPRWSASSRLGAARAEAQAPE
jgi:hypothetical protein